MNISWWISDAAARMPTKTAVRFESRDVTYRMLEERVAVLAGRLREAGVVDGDRIAYLGPVARSCSRACSPAPGSGRSSYRSTPECRQPSFRYSSNSPG